MSSKVYFIRASVSEGEKVISDKSVKLFRAGGFEQCFEEKDFTAVKVHVGEGANTTYLKPGFIKGLVEELIGLDTKPFVTDTSTLYTGRRHNAIDHSVLAAEHGFSVGTLGVPFIVPDGLFGTAETGVKIDGLLNKEVFVARDIARCQSILSIAHCTGHLATCLAATLKTLGMGCASRKGKMRQHAALKPSVKDNCTRCGQCVKYCPEEAITLDEVKAHIDRDKCIGCAECVAVCRFDAVTYDFDVESDILQKQVAEHAAGVLAGKQGRAVFFNYAISVTSDCDCFGTANMHKIVDDIGIFASTDAVAVDAAALEMIEQASGKDLQELTEREGLDARRQLEHAERIGLGTCKYELVEVS